MMNELNTSWESNRSNSINNHHCEYGQEAKHLFTVLHSLIIVVGLIGNALVVWVITVGAHLKSMTDVCLLNLALADLLLVSSLSFIVYQMNHSWIFGKATCPVVYGMYYVGFYGCIFFIVLMSIDRYLAIVHAVFALRVRTKTRGIVVSLVTWILAVFASFPELLYNEVAEWSSKLYCLPYRYDLTFAVILKINIAGLLVPLSIVVFCYSMILWRLHRSHSPKKQSMRLVVLVMVVFFCCWTPYNITVFLIALQHKGVIPFSCGFIKQIELTVSMTRVLAYSHSCMNPFLYVFVGQKFRQHLLSLIRERRPICCS